MHFHRCFTLCWDSSELRWLPQVCDNAKHISLISASEPMFCHVLPLYEGNDSMRQPEVRSSGGAIDCAQLVSRPSIKCCSLWWGAAMQVASRIWVLWGIVYLVPWDTTNGRIGAMGVFSPTFASLMAAWCLSEIIRYGFFAARVLPSLLLFSPRWYLSNISFGICRCANGNIVICRACPLMVTLFGPTSRLQVLAVILSS